MWAFPLRSLPSWGTWTQQQWSRYSAAKCAVKGRPATLEVGKTSQKWLQLYEVLKGELRFAQGLGGESILGGGTVAWMQETLQGEQPIVWFSYIQAPAKKVSVDRGGQEVGSRP